MRKLSMLFVAILVIALVPITVFGQGKTLTAASTGCTDAACLEVPLTNNVGSVSVQLGAFTGTVQFEGSANNGTTRVALSGTSTTGTSASSATSAGLWQFSVSGLTNFYVRCSTYSTAIPVNVNRSSAGFTPPASFSGNLSVGAVDQGSAGSSAWPVSLPSATVSTLTPPAAITGYATSTKQSDGSQKAQIVDGSGNVIGATSNALDVNVKSGGGSGLSSSDYGTTGAPSSHILTVQGNASGVAQPVSASALPLPTGAATSALQGQDSPPHLVLAAE